MSDAVRRWLDEDTSVRAAALVRLDGRDPDEPEVARIRRDGYAQGSAARVLDGLGGPFEPATFYVPKYGAPFHRLVAAAEMGVRADEPRAAAALEFMLSRFRKADGGFGNPLRDGPGHLCVTGNAVRAALLMGQGGDPRVLDGLRWLVEHQRADGGWHCFPPEDAPSTLDAWEALAALAALPEKARDEPARRAAARGREFLLAAHLGARDAYAPWRRAHFPRHYYYDVLVGLGIVAALGGKADARLREAQRWLEEKRRPDGRWTHEAHHPDLEGEADYTPHRPGVGAPAPLVVEEAGAPSRWVTLEALVALR